jgi:hypothetical protein
MSHSIVCSSQQELGGYDSFFFQEQNPEPCSLTLDDFHYHELDRPYHGRTRPQQVFSDEPRRWADILFEPGDVIEVRFLPARVTTAGLQPRQFMQTKTAVQHGIYRWPFAFEIDCIVDKLAELNQGTATWWGLWNKQDSKWTDVAGQSGIPLNIYASANPRITTGGTTSDDVWLARSLFVDLEKITVEEAAAKVAAAGLPKPTMIVVSGHGVHLYWRLLKPMFDLGHWTSIQKRLIQLLGSDPAVHDPARMMRLPGFMNVNGDPARCYIHDANPDRRYSLEDILPVLPPEPPKATKPNTPAKSFENIDGGNLSIVGQSPDVLHRAEAYADRFNPVGENRNSTIFSRTCALAEKFDLDADQILPLVEKANDKADNPLDIAEVEEVVEKAVRHIRKKGKPRGTALARPSRVEEYREPSGPVIELEEWRRQMTDARIESLDQTGKVFFDGSTTGAGKSTADLTAMKKAGSSAIFLPTHDACEELATTLTQNGLSAAAHPPLDNTTCLKFGTKNDPGPAQLALKAGLNVGQCVCTSCDHANICEYQKRREQARTADHTIATHARASLSDFHPAVDKPVVFIHEDAVALLRPVAKLVRYSTKTDIPQGRHLRDILVIAQAAEDIAVEWSDDGAREFSRRLKAATGDLLAVLDGPDLVKPLQEAANAGKATVDLPSVKALPLRPNFPRHVQIDYLLRRAMDRVNIHSNATALKLALGYTLGELTDLCAVVDEIKVKGGRPSFTKALIGVWKVELPSDTVVWLENASATAGLLSEIVGQEVIDKTPQGRLAYKVPPLQFPDADITQQSCGNTVRSVVRGLLAQYPQAHNVGIITQQCHVAEIKMLAPMWQYRISRIEYFYSGKDRASNSWLDCDLILVIGTPRVPPVAVRDMLIRLGRVGAASHQGKFEGLTWEGKTVSGNSVRIDGLGYAEPSWAEVHSLLVKETLRQAIGRGRGVTDKGVPVLVASNESLGLALADQPLRLVSDAEDDTLQLAVSASARNAINNTIANRAVAPVVTSTVAAISRYKLRAVRQHLSSLNTHGLLRKKGDRGGWIVADWLLSDQHGSEAPISEAHRP